MSDAILTINSGSSSIKFAVFAWTHADNSPQLLYRGEITGIGHRCEFTIRNRTGKELAVSKKILADTEKIKRQEDAFSVLFEWIDQGLSKKTTLVAVGHRIVHGGENYASPVILNETILHDLKKLIPLAPLHQPYQIAAIEAFSLQQPELPQTACFDTAFHRSQPAVAQQFALPKTLQQEGILRYGFHGLSYEYIAGILPEYLNNTAEGRVIVAHLGHGASMCALKSRQSIATTMSFSPLDGLPMSTRCGSLDPSVVIYLMQEKGMDIESISDLLNNKSGLLGVSEISSDMQTLLNNDDAQAEEAVELFVYRTARELGSLAAALGGLDALVFTAGIGEHSPVIRERICRNAAWLGIEIDEVANLTGNSRISTTNSPVSTWIIPTDEESIIARHTAGLIKQHAKKQES